VHTSLIPACFESNATHGKTQISTRMKGMLLPTNFAAPHLVPVNCISASFEHRGENIAVFWCVTIPCVHSLRC